MAGFGPTIAVISALSIPGPNSVPDMTAPNRHQVGSPARVMHVTQEAVGNCIGASETGILTHQQKTQIQTFVENYGYNTLPEVTESPMIVQIGNCLFHIKKGGKNGSIFAGIEGKMGQFIQQ